MEWSDKDTFKFLELFQKEPIIWDPKNKYHKNNQIVNDAWVRLSEEMGRPVLELKNKKNSLMATFRQHLRRKKQSLKSGAGENDVYKPVWLYYDAMETFLASVYKCHATINTEEGLISPVLHNVDDETHNNNEQNINDQHDEQNSEKQKPANNKKTFKSPTKKKRAREDSETDIHKNIKDTVSNLNKMLLNRKENDECDLYAQLLATRLREYSKQERRQIMHGIDGLLLANPPQQLQKIDTYYRYTPSPTYSSSSSSRTAQQSLIQISIPDRSFSRNSYSSQPQQSPIDISILDRPTSSNSHVLQPQVLGAISSHSGTATVDIVLSSQDCVTVLSHEVIQRPDSNNIIDTAFINALSDESY